MGLSHTPLITVCMHRSRGHRGSRGSRRSVSCQRDGTVETVTKIVHKTPSDVRALLTLSQLGSCGGSVTSGAFFLPFLAAFGGMI